MKLVIETGSGAHTTSSASMQVKFHGGPFDGQHLYQQKQFQIKVEWDTSKNHEKWVTSQFELPAGTEIEVIGRGRTGPRGVNHDDFHRIYRLEETADLLDTLVDVGLRKCTLKGRLFLLRDVLAENQAHKKIDLEEGF